jgi:hypothetical protein
VVVEQEEPLAKLLVRLPALGGGAGGRGWFEFQDEHRVPITARVEHHGNVDGLVGLLWGVVLLYGFEIAKEATKHVE